VEKKRKDIAIMLFDTHMHTRFSTDSQMTIERALEKAQELKIGITITEHLDLAYPTPDTFFDVDEYFRAYAKYRCDQVLLGVEIGMRPECLHDNREFIEKNSFDYVIGSIHIVDNMDVYYETFYGSRTKREVYNQYFEAMTQCLKTYDCIDSLGHIDYIARYARYEDTEIYYEEFCDHIDAVLSVLAEKQKAIEINTRRLDSKVTIQALLPIYKRFYELGGRWVTIGSDAHRPEEIGKRLDVANEIASLCGLTVVCFKQREMQYYK
jgi:histidinol-phosphatase (PHP family)